MVFFFREFFQMSVKLIQLNIVLGMIAFAKAMIHQHNCGISRDRNRWRKIPEDCNADNTEGSPKVALRAYLRQGNSHRSKTNAVASPATSLLRRLRVTEAGGMEIKNAG